MAALDYLRFEKGNLLSDAYVGIEFQTLDLFGYFEQYRVRVDGTICLIPTALVPSGQMQKSVNAPELIKVDLPPVQIIIDYNVTVTSDEVELDLQFVKGSLVAIKRKRGNVVVAA